MSEPARAKWGLPEEVIYCKRCVESNQRMMGSIQHADTKDSKKDTTIFDEEGVCDACRHAEQKESIDWEKREELIQGRLAQQTEYSGVKRFKRRTLGICGRSTTKTSDQMIQILCETQVVSTPEEAKQILPHLEGRQRGRELARPRLDPTQQ